MASLKPMNSHWLFRRLEKIKPSFWMTFGNTIYYPSYLSKADAAWKYPKTVKHEMVHVSQYKKYTIPGFLLLYFLVPFPVFFSYFRWKFEREAYLTNLQGLPQAAKEGYIDWIVDVLWVDYWWTWPKPLMRRWFRKKVGLK